MKTETEIKKTKKVRTTSLGTKTSAAILIFSVLLIATSIFISYFVYANTMDNHYKSLAVNVARTAATFMDGDKIPGYVETKQTDAEYDRMLTDLFSIKNNNEVLYLYVETIDLERGVATYVLDADENDPCPLGYEAKCNPDFEKYNDNIKTDGIPGQINYTEEYGWLCTACQPILNSQGDLAAIACVDISMNEIMNDRQNFLLMLISVMVLTTLVFILIALIIVRKHIVQPLKMLTNATQSFVSDKGKEGDSQISKLNIRSHDEISQLSDAVILMEKDINAYIENLKNVTAEKERIGAELNVATNIQASMLPCIFPPFPERDEFDIYASMNPAKEVGGDFYDFFLIDEDNLALVMADVSGKGVPAALFMVIAKTLIKNYAQLGLPVDKVFSSTNEQLCENNDAGMFVTAFMGILNVKEHVFTFVNAGHNAPLVKRAGGSYEWLSMKRGFVLAGMEGTKFTAEQIPFNKGDIIFTYTDGVTEALNNEKELFSDADFSKAHRARTLDPSGLLHAVKTEITIAEGADQADDINDARAQK